MTRKILHGLLFVFIVSAVSAQTDKEKVDQIYGWLNSGQATSQSFIDPRIAALSAYNKTGSMTWEDLLEWTIVFSTIGISDWEANVDLVYGSVIEAVFELQVINPTTTTDMCEAINNYLHDNFLKEYDEHQSRLDELFVSGRYNCMSSAALYLILCRALGLQCNGYLTGDHAFICVYDANDVTILVEPTSGTCEVLAHSDGYISRYQKYIKVKEDVYFVSTILRNRISRNDLEHNYLTSLILLFNLAASTDNLDVEGICLYKPPKDLLFNWILYYSSNLIDSGKSQEALELLNLTATCYYDDPELRRLTVAVIDRIAAGFINAAYQTPERAEEILELIHKERAFFNPARLEDLVYFTINNTCIDISKFHGGRSAAAAFIENALMRYGEIGRVKKLLERYKNE